MVENQVQPETHGVGFHRENGELYCDNLKVEEVR